VGLAATELVQAASARQLGVRPAGSRRCGAGGEEQGARQQEQNTRAHYEYLAPSANCSVTPIRSLNSLKERYRSPSGSTASRWESSRRKSCIARAATNNVSTGSKITA